VPLLNATTDRGVGYGLYAAAFLTDSPPSSDASVPYRAQVGAQFYQTTGGYQDHKLVVDLPQLAGGRLRADTLVGLESWDGAFYFGQGNRLPRLPVAETPADFYTFGLQSLRVVSTLRTPLVGSLDLFVRQLARAADITVYPDSRLEMEQPVGAEGGLLSQVSIGLIYDTRNHEITPSEGVFSEVSFRGAHPAIGSSWTMWGANLTDRRYWSFEGPGLVLAVRAAGDIQKGTPFFHQPVMGGSQWVDIGGPLAMRGLSIGRYRGDVTLYGDTELRWHAADFSIKRAAFRLFAVTFVGGAQIIQPDEADGVHVHGGGGGGLRLLYNDVFLVRMDLAAGREEYTDLDDPLGSAVVDSAWVPGFYLAFSAPF